MARRTSDELVSLLRAKTVVERAQLREALGNPSDVTVHRYLKQISYRTSYNHNGRYYTLHEPSRYDRWGLFSVGDIHFSVDGTARATVVRLVEEAETGRTAPEMRDLMHVRVQPHLLAATRDGALQRKRVGRSFVYLHGDEEIAAEQLRRREEAMQPAEPEAELDPETIIRVLLVVIGHPASQPADVVRRLAGRAPPITRDQVGQVFTRYGLDEKRGPRIY